MFDCRSQISDCCPEFSAETADATAERLGIARSTSLMAGLLAATIIQNLFEQLPQIVKHGVFLVSARSSELAGYLPR